MSRQKEIIPKSDAIDAMDHVIAFAERTVVDFTDLAYRCRSIRDAIIEGGDPVSAAVNERMRKTMLDFEAKTKDAPNG